MEPLRRVLQAIKDVLHIESLDYWTLADQHVTKATKQAGRLCIILFVQLGHNKILDGIYYQTRTYCSPADPADRDHCS